jgi:hypothetical protein
MEAVRVPPNGALQKAREAVVIYQGRRGFVAEVGITSIFAFPALLGVIVGSLFFIVFYGAMALGVAFVASQHCYRVGVVSEREARPALLRASQCHHMD